MGPWAGGREANVFTVCLSKQQKHFQKGVLSKKFLLLKEILFFTEKRGTNKMEESLPLNVSILIKIYFPARRSNQARGYNFFSC